MRIVLCSEGARPDSGGFGLVAVPQIAGALADLGHHVILEMFGSPIYGSEPFLTRGLPGARRERVVAYSYPARGRYAYSRVAWNNVKEHISHADFVMLHSLYSFAVLSGYLASRRYEKRYGLWPHGVLAPFQRRVSAHKKIVYDALVARRILGQASVLFYNALGERDEVASLQLRAPSVIIPHGIDLEPYAHLPPRGAFRQKFFNGFDGALVLYLGRLNAKKGLDVLVQAMARVRAQMPMTRLAIVGTGDPPGFTEQLRQWIRDARLQNEVVLCGALRGHEKMNALADADLFVLPSFAENFSYAMFEAMASHIPVVISDTLNFAPEVARGCAGRVVARTADAFADAICELSVSSETRRQMGAGGARLAARYSWDIVGKQLERALQAVVSNQSLPRDLVAGQAHT